MIRLFYYNNTWFNVDNDVDSQNLLDKGAVEYLPSQIRGVEGNESWVSNDTMFQDEQGNWYFEKTEPKVTVEDRIKEIQNAVQILLDNKAQERNYDNGFAIASYANSTDTIFRNEANAFIAWRDQCWRKCYEILADFQQGNIEIPTVDYVLNELPVLDWNDL